MDLKEKQLLLADLCARLPYGVKVYNEPYIFDLDNFEFNSTISGTILEIIKKGWKPYLRPMSSITGEEKKELKDLHFYYTDSHIVNDEDKDFKPIIVDEVHCSFVIDWLSAHHFDYRGLIEKGLALIAPTEMYE